MATERQIKANRANAKRSTGPKTKQGRLMSSRNALRHGLASSVRSQLSAPVVVKDLAEVLIRPEANEIQAIAALQTAQAHAELLRVRGAKVSLFVSLAAFAEDTRILRQLLALDRYERVACGKRRLATSQL